MGCSHFMLCIALPFALHAPPPMPISASGRRLGRPFWEFEMAASESRETYPQGTRDHPSNLAEARQLYRHKESPAECAMYLGNISFIEARKNRYETHETASEWGYGLIACHCMSLVYPGANPAWFTCTLGTEIAAERTDSPFWITGCLDDHCILVTMTKHTQTERATWESRQEWDSTKSQEEY